MKPIASVLFVLLVVLQIQLWFGTHGVFKLPNLEDAIVQQIDINEQLAARNQQLHAQVIELKEGREALEDRARSHLGFIKEGEVFYRIIPAADEAASSSN